MTLYEIFWYFIIYSFLGWVTEVIYQGMEKGLVVNRGFLNGPVCPIYGFGILAVLALANMVSIREESDMSGLMLFAFGVVLATAIELLGGWALDKIFHARWWDYSQKPFNFHGYICLEFSIIWGLAITFVIRVVHPTIRDTSVALIPEKYGIPILIALYGIYLADFVVTIMILHGLNKNLADLDSIQQDMRRMSDSMSTFLGENAVKTGQQIQENKVQAALAKSEMKDAVREQRTELEKRIRERRAQREARIEKLLSGKMFSSRRILRAFPDMQHRDYAELIDELKKRIS